jgi:hypothetical protein
MPQTLQSQLTDYGHDVHTGSFRVFLTYAYIVYIVYGLFTSFSPLLNVSVHDVLS